MEQYIIVAVIVAAFVAFFLMERKDSYKKDKAKPASPTNLMDPSKWEIGPVTMTEHNWSRGYGGGYPTPSPHPEGFEIEMGGGVVPDGKIVGKGAVHRDRVRGRLTKMTPAQEQALRFLRQGHAPAWMGRFIAKLAAIERDARGR